MLKRSRRALLASLLLPALLLAALHLGCTQAPQTDTGAAGDGYLFCFWNVENLFDDRNDGRSAPGDKEFDGWLAGHA